MNMIKYMQKNEQDSIIGELHLESMDTTEFKHHNFRLVLIKTDSVRSSSIDMIKIKNELLDYLNFHSYNQVFIKWEISPDKPLDTLDLIGKLPLKYQNDTLKRIGNQFFDTLKIIYNSKIVKKETHYIFISDKVLTDFMGRSSLNPFPNHSNDLRFVIMSYKAKNIYELYTHELGHNNRLWHPVNSVKIPIKSTQNYMDYSYKLNMFWRWQGIKMRIIQFEPK